jgi:hypothetical protein
MYILTRSSLKKKQKEVSILKIFNPFSHLYKNITYFIAAAEKEAKKNIISNILLLLVEFWLSQC